MSRLLGGNTFTRAVMSAVEQIPEIEPQWLFLDADSYRRYPDRWRWPFESARVKRRQYLAEADKNFDVLFISGFELIRSFRDVIGRKPTILAADSTNLGAYQLLADWRGTLLRRMEYWLKARVTHPLYYPLVQRLACVLPRTDWAAGQFLEDYGLPPGRVRTTPVGLDLQHWDATGERVGGQVLFVGNDFVRKGGELLLEAFSSAPLAGASLVLLSNDPGIADYALPTNVQWVSGLTDPDEVRDYYATSELFVYPTRKDQQGMALAEAAAMSLPILATDVGAVGEIVRPGVNGELLTRNAGVADWRRAIVALLRDEGKRRSYGAASRALAENRFSKARLTENLLWAFEKVTTC